VNQYTTVSGRIDNVLNQRYQNPTGDDRPGWMASQGFGLSIDSGR